MKTYEYISYIIPADLTKPVEEFVTEASPSLGRLQAAVGGYIERVPYFTAYNGRTRGTAYANEEGVLKGLPPNIRASEAWQRQFPAGTGLVGPVIISFRREKLGETE